MTGVAWRARRWVRQRIAWRSLKTPKPFRCRTAHDHRYILGPHGIGFAELTCARCGRRVEITS